MDRMTTSVMVVKVKINKVGTTISTMVGITRPIRMVKILIIMRIKIMTTTILQKVKMSLPKTCPLLKLQSLPRNLRKHVI
jgi:hypothetical protein